MTKTGQKVLDFCLQISLRKTNPAKMSEIFSSGWLSTSDRTLVVLDSSFPNLYDIFMRSRIASFLVNMSLKF